MAAVAVSGFLKSSEVVAKSICSSTNMALDTVRTASSLGTPCEVNHAVNMSVNGGGTPMVSQSSLSLAAEGAWPNNKTSNGSRMFVEAARSAILLASAAGTCHSTSCFRSIGPSNNACLMPKLSHNTLTDSTVALLPRTASENARLHLASRCTMGDEIFELANCKASSRTPRRNSHERNIGRITSSVAPTPVPFASSISSSTSSAMSPLHIKTFAIASISSSRPNNGLVDIDSAIVSGTSKRARAAFLIARRTLSGGADASVASCTNSSSPPFSCTNNVVIKSATVALPSMPALEQSFAKSDASDAGTPQDFSFSVINGASRLVTKLMPRALPKLTMSSTVSFSGVTMRTNWSSICVNTDMPSTLSETKMARSRGTPHNDSRPRINGLRRTSRGLMSKISPSSSKRNDKPGTPDNKLITGSRTSAMPVAPTCAAIRIASSSRKPARTNAASTAILPTAPTTSKPAAAHLSGGAQNGL
mmetsp:Transcript_108928/g.313781  ORF Transcript_108928/g.313781 Transcript_108928/m.313781 type:complete len:477 (+) Transcript_108928:1096-2526(+)